jgi:MerR-like DNA binding protein
LNKIVIRGLILEAKLWRVLGFMNSTLATKQNPRRGLPVQRVNVLKRKGLGVPEPPPYLTGDELAYRWRVDRASIKYYVKKGILTPDRLTSRTFRFKLSDIERLEKEAGV